MGAIYHVGDAIGATPPIDDTPANYSNKTIRSSEYIKNNIEITGTITLHSSTAYMKNNIVGTWRKIGTNKLYANFSLVQIDGQTIDTTNDYITFDGAPTQNITGYNGTVIFKALDGTVNGPNATGYTISSSTTSNCKVSSFINASNKYSMMAEGVFN